MRYTKLIALGLLFIVLQSVCFGQLDDYYNRVKKNPEMDIKVLNDNIELVNVYKYQIKLLHENKGLPLLAQQDSFAIAMYREYPMLWESFYGINKYKELLKEDWEILHNPNVIGIWLPFSFDIETTFEEIGNEFYKLTGYIPQGKWFLFYGTGQGIGDMGGNARFMWANFPVIGQKESFVFNLPHEFHHMVFFKTNKSENNLLRYIIDEGIACYVNEIYWKNEYSSAEIILFENKDWKWALKNEKRIFEFAKQDLSSKDYEVINKYHSWGESIWEDAPYRLAYFIGYRIIKAYIEKYGEESLKDLYTMDCKQILDKSDYEISLK